MAKTLADISGAMRDIDFCTLSARTADGSIGARPMSNNREVDFTTAAAASQPTKQLRARADRGRRKRWRSSTTSSPGAAARAACSPIG
ncbi:MAG: hypothetical protein QM676_12825 [Novosphingobium sp.]